MAARGKASPAKPQRTLAELEAELVKRTAERDEALARENAIGEVLAVINSSPGDPEPVWGAMLERAARLCDGSQGVLWTLDNGSMRAAAMFGITPEYAAFLRQGISPGPRTPMGRIMQGERVVEILDLVEDEGYRAGDPVPRAAVEIGGFRSMIFVALVKNETLLGGFAIARREVRPFTDRQIALLQNFAAQAVIAIENARLIAETREALDQQTATAEVLQVINSSPGDLKPVFEAMLEKATSLCEATFGTLWTWDGEHMHAAAVLGATPQYTEFLRAGPHQPNPIAHQPLLRGAPVVHIADVSAHEGYQSGVALPSALVDLGRVRTLLAVPLRKEAALLGVFSIYRDEVRSFSDKQIALLQNFADQAVIAIENTRLITETREALEQQTATAEVLQVINASPGDLAPVFDAILEKAHRLCGVTYGSLQLYDGDMFRAVAVHDLPAALADQLRRGYRPRPGLSNWRLLEGESFAQVLDMAAVDDPIARITAENGIRTLLWVALRKDGVLLGNIAAARREVRPFSDKEIALLQNFAAQAVIAMENARLITETREALEQQTATAEVLGVINASPGELAPVFDAMLEKATGLCEAAFGELLTYDGAVFHPAAERGVPAVYSEFMRQNPPAFKPGTGPARLLDGERVVHFRDAMDTDLYRSGDPDRRAIVDLAGARSILLVPLLKDNAVCGAFTIFRQEVRPFSEKQIALLQNFAAQAVIAMENARLITETREALDQQTATSEVLQVINSSPGDLAPVFDVMLERARGLCGAAFGTFMLRDGERFSAAAVHGAVPKPFAAIVRQGLVPSPSSPIGRLRNGEPFVHVPDLAEVASQISDDPVPRAAVEFGGIRTLLMVPLIKDGQLLGVFTNFRQEVRPFSDKQIALLQNFAAQAVIAMDNARLITETREALEQQTATAEVLGVINASPGDLAPVFEAMLEKARTLCDAAFGLLFVEEGDAFRAIPSAGVPDGFADFLRREPLRLGPETHVGQITRQGVPFVHVADIRTAELYLRGTPIAVAGVELGDARTLLTVPMHRNGLLLGIFQLIRQEVRPFTDKQIALLQNFAAQAVIAMENARLITETREALDQQTATAEVLGVINSSPGDLTPVFDAMLEKALRLCEAGLGLLLIYEDGRFRTASLHGAPDAYAAFITRETIRPGPGTGLARLARDRRLVHIADLTEDDAYRERDPLRVASVELAGMRTFLAVPLAKDEALMGAFVVYRQEVRPFTDKQIALLQNFAAQAVIAMENARLITETRERSAELQEALEYQTATSDVLKVISRTDAKLEAVLETLVRTAARICAADQGAIHQLRDGLHFVAASWGTTPEYRDYVAGNPVKPGRDTAIGRMALDRRVIHIEDALNDPEYAPNEFQRLGGFRTMLAEPLLREDVVIGSILLTRSRVEPFTDSQIELVRTFADQAVIAIENARLLGEIRDARDIAEATLGDLKAAQANLIQAEKMASLGQLTAGIAHEIKNPLNFVNNFASLSVELLDELKEATEPAVAALDDDKRAEIDETMVMLTGNLEKIAEHGKRADNIVKSMLEHSRGVSGERREVDLNGVIEEALSLAYHGARAQDQSFNITLERDYASTLKPIELAPQEMTRVFLNLFGNGFYAAAKRARENGDGSFRPSITVTTREDGDAVEVRVRDNGTGIPAAIKDKLFQPFFTTKPTGEGTGLGLSISYDIVTQQHGGTITVESEPGSFTEFTVRLPRH